MYPIAGQYPRFRYGDTVTSKRNQFDNNTLFVIGIGHKFMPV